MFGLFVDNPVQYGTIHVLAHYQGRELYNNRLDMCTAEKGDKVQILKCPIERGLHYFVKEANVSPLLPKVCSKHNSLQEGNSKS